MSHQSSRTVTRQVHCVAQKRCAFPVVLLLAASILPSPGTPTIRSIRVVPNTTQIIIQGDNLVSVTSAKFTTQNGVTFTQPFIPFNASPTISVILPPSIPQYMAVLLNSISIWIIFYCCYITQK